MNRQLELGAEWELEPKYYIMGCRRLEQHLNRWVKCPLFHELIGAPSYKDWYSVL